MKLLYNKQFRDIITQLFVVTVVVFFIWHITGNLLHNIDKRGITTGLEFFEHRAGFGISETPIAYDEDSTYFRAFLVGIINTLYVSFIGIVFASIIGLFVGIARLSKNFIVSKVAWVYIEFFRNIPLLLQILFWYNIVLSSLPRPRQSLSLGLEMFLNNRGLYVPKPIFESGFIYVIFAFVIAIFMVYYFKKWVQKQFDETGKEYSVLLPSIAILIIIPTITYIVVGNAISFDYPALRGFNFKGGMSFSPEFLALTFALSIYTASLIAEAIRSGIESVPKGQTEAALSLGLSKYQALKFVILPQAIRVAIPPIIGQYLNLIKNSSLATAIGYPEIVTVFAGTVLNQTGQAIEIIAVTMAVYLTISLFVSFILNIVNKKLEIKGR